MDMNTVLQIIGSVGFPIVMCLLMYDRMGKQDDLHREEMSKLNESLNNNTQAIVRLTEKLDKEVND